MRNTRNSVADYVADSDYMESKKKPEESEKDIQSMQDWSYNKALK